MTSEIAFAFIFGAQLPSPWPPKREGVLLERVEDDWHFRLLCLSDGSLEIQVVWTKSGFEATRFQPLDVPSGAYVVVSIRGAPGYIELRINSVNLLENADGRAAVVKIDTPSGPIEQRKLLFPGLSAAQGHNSHQRLFLGKVADIDQKLCAGDWYSLIAASGLIRSLVLDAATVFGLANQGFSLKPSFRSIGSKFKLPELSAETEMTMWNGCMPPHGGELTKLVGLDDFLNSPLLITSDKVIAKVSDVIKLCANTKGGVHVDKVTKAPQVALVNWGEQFPEPQHDMNVYAISSIGIALLEGLTPLIDAIRQPNATPSA